MSRNLVDRAVLAMMGEPLRLKSILAFWLPLEDGPQRLSYKGEREVVELALEYVKAHPELGEYAANTAH